MYDLMWLLYDFFNITFQEIDKVKSNIKLSKLECANLKNENGIIEDEMSKYETIVQQLKEQIEIHKTNRELKFELLLMAQKN